MDNGAYNNEVERDGKVRRKGEDLEELLLGFAARVGQVVDALPDTRLGRHGGGQLVRSGTSPVPNYAEACAVESKKDFIHKLGSALKELRENRIWLRLIVWFPLAFSTNPTAMTASEDAMPDVGKRHSRGSWRATKDLCNSFRISVDHTEMGHSLTNSE
jgi:four helix bundle protein